MITSIRIPEQTHAVIAISQKDGAIYGCPYCGYQSGFAYIQNSQAGLMECGECHQPYIFLAEGVNQSTIGVGDTFPTLQSHPRHGIPSHSRPDKRPEGGGEFFKSRGIGLDSTPGCFVCGGRQGMYNNIAAYVQTKAAGERIVTMFVHGARLDFREHEPEYIQVKVGACKKHLPQLEYLHELTAIKQIIMEEMIQIASRYTPVS